MIAHFGFLKLLQRSLQNHSISVRQKTSRWSRSRRLFRHRLPLLLLAVLNARLGYTQKIHLFGDTALCLDDIIGRSTIDTRANLVHKLHIICTELHFASRHAFAFAARNATQHGITYNSILIILQTKLTDHNLRFVRK
ncbi:hypothetical protein PsorP6_000644 [Peronosclerospora sorghi]|uniref:Uncharacterized protein n=1 Tax=Peronosclerospora sorghi TaxID=230839 RepID=A0ACC0WUT6_9STRA|nr:hypothetical protein PsorP6_000644 [Peronosclerospora sorghi]